MTDTQTPNLGGALTALGLEDKFLANGQLSTFPLVERGRLANDIIAEKLRLGRWQTVVQMIYGGLGKADALFEGDRNELKDRIVAAAQQHANAEMTSSTLDTLVRAKEHDLLFRLATNTSLGYEDLMTVVGNIPTQYFKDDTEGLQKRQRLEKAAGQRALTERKYGAAVRHFREIGDTTSLTTLFDEAWNSSYPHVDINVLEAIAVSDPAQKDNRLKEIVSRYLTEEVDHKQNYLVNAIRLFKLVKQHSVGLSPEQKATLQERVVKEASRYQFEGDQELATEQELLLPWAKHHATSQPRDAYKIFVDAGFEGAEVVKAVQAGLDLERHQNDHRVLETSQVKESHLRQAYESAPFGVQVKIAHALKDGEKLQSLSKKAAKRSNEKSYAYHLWIAGQGDLSGEYITTLRAQLIKEEIKTHGLFGFLDITDKQGMTQAYDAIMQHQASGKPNVKLIREAHELALRIGDEERMQRTREILFSISPSSALEVFQRGNSIRTRDEKGIEYVLSTVASQHGVPQSTLRDLVAKYRR